MSLHLSLPETEVYDSRKEEFLTIPTTELEFEYSLYTVSLWEAKWKKPFLSSFAKLPGKEKIDFIKTMCVTPNVDGLLWLRLTQNDYRKIWKYVGDPMSATTVKPHSDQKSGRKEIVTTEVIYYWMASLGIPYECEHWHLNRLLKLIQVGFIKNSPAKKMSKRETAAYYRSINEKRLAQYKTRG